MTNRTGKVISLPSAVSVNNIMPSAEHSTQQYENKRCELFHQPGRQKERQMRRFTSQGQAQRFLARHGVVKTSCT
jgi:transposase-like protein